MNINLHRKFLLLTGKAIVVALTLLLLYQAVFTAPDMLLTWQRILRQAWGNPQGYALLLCAVVLIPVNWGFEAGKWQLLGQRVEPMAFWQAYRAVMVGLTLGFITPNRLGDYAGRVLELKSQQRLEAIGAIFMGRFCQLVATVLAGTLGLTYFVYNFYWQQYPAVFMSVMVLFIAFVAITLSLLYNARAMVALVSAVRPLKRFVPYIAIMSAYTRPELNKLLVLSLGRYFVFLIQFVLLLMFFGVKLSLLAYFCGVSGTFFLKSVVPSVSLISDLGVRELSAMFLFGMLGQGRLEVLSASLTLWLLNIAVPSAFGLYFVLRLRFARKEVLA
ncbi:lysylphosphatidylglycerol synthase domain-containing protein [Pontibacter sp. CAU 1760]